MRHVHGCGGSSLGEEEIAACDLKAPIQINNRGGEPGVGPPLRIGKRGEVLYCGSPVLGSRIKGLRSGSALKSNMPSMELAMASKEP